MSGRDHNDDPSPFGGIRKVPAAYPLNRRAATGFHQSLMNAIARRWWWWASAELPCVVRESTTRNISRFSVIVVAA
jgi:hypothetical protein